MFPSHADKPSLPGGNHGIQGANFNTVAAIIALVSILYREVIHESKRLFLAANDTKSTPVTQLFYQFRLDYSLKAQIHTPGSSTINGAS